MNFLVIWKKNKVHCTVCLPFLEASVRFLHNWIEFYLKDLKCFHIIFFSSISIFFLRLFCQIFLTKFMASCLTNFLTNFFDEFLAKLFEEFFNEFFEEFLLTNFLTNFLLLFYYGNWRKILSNEQMHENKNASFR